MRRVITTITCLVFLASTIGMPIPQLSQKTQEDYPCRTHACGCLNADMCRQHCSCFKSLVSNSCCKLSKTPGSSNNTDSKNKFAANGFVIKALECQGLTAHWVSLGAFVQKIFQSADIQLCDNRVSMPVMIDNLRPISSIQPDDPPPRA